MKRLLKILLILFLPTIVCGQLTPLANHYLLNPMTINPAYAGNRGALNMALFYWKQWVGIKGAPETMTFAIDAPLRDKKVGLGLMIVNDRVGVTKETQFISNYSYKINIKEGILSFGLGAGVAITNTAFSDLVVLDPGDEFFLNDSRIFVVPNFSFGLHYSYHNYFAGISIPKFLNYKFNFNKNKYVLLNDPGLYNYLLNTGYIFEISPKLKIFPSTLISYTPGGKFLYDINSQVNFLDRFWLGVSYRNNRSITGLFQFQINNQLRFAYSYDFDIGKLGRYSNGSHEIMLRYEFRYKVDVLNPLIF
jgi:type IX secretion system PorP/SprF family membrane protein